MRCSSMKTTVTIHMITQRSMEAWEQLVYKIKQSRCMAAEENSYTTIQDQSWMRGFDKIYYSVHKIKVELLK